MQTDRFRRPIDPALAIFIMRTPGDGSHTGILFRMNRVLIIQDLLWHERFRSQACDQVPHYALLLLEPEEEHDVRMRCEQIHARRNDPSRGYRIPYAFRHGNNNRFNPDGEFMLRDGLGLSCSTFVLTVFQSVGITLVNFDTWQSRPGDIARHEALLQMMRDHNVSAPHIALAAQEVACMRVRPEEVAATAMFNDHPATFVQLEPAGAWILAQIPPLA